MGSIRLIALLACIVVMMVPALAVEPDAVVVARSVGCYHIETLNSYDELFGAGDHRAAQRLMFVALAQGDCVVLAGRTRAFRQIYRDYRTCVRPANQTSCLWIDNGVLRSW